MQGSTAGHCDGRGHHLQLESRGPGSCPSAGWGGSPTQPRVSLKRPPCQWAPHSEALPPGSLPALLFLWPSSLLSTSLKELLSPPLLSGPLSATPCPPQLVGAAGSREECGWICLLAVRPWNGAPAGQGGAQRLQRAGTWRIRVRGPLQVRRESLFVLLSNRKTSKSGNSPPENIHQQCVP